ncbi:MAG: biosynthetic-type acetolactate synthase large subunit [Thermodesulfobacteriota bacterium]
MSKMTGGQVLLESLRQEGVEVIFGLPGGVLLPLYDEIYKEEFRHILVRHEQGAVHAAEGYARTSGKVGVVLVTSGPGGTNTVTGIVNAYMDSSPVVVFTGQVPTPLIGNDAFQEADIVGITRTCTKHNYLVKELRDLPRIVKEAFYLARTGRPGPVLVDLPKDVLTDTLEFSYPSQIHLRGYNPNYQGHPGQIDKALRLLGNAERPLIYFGGGVILSDSAELLTNFAKGLNIPLTSTLMGLGGFPGTDDLWLGMAGMHGSYAANMALTHCDILLAIGARFDDRITGKVDEFAPKAEIIHVDIDPTSIQKNIKVSVPIVGDVGQVLTKMIELTESGGQDGSPSWKSWLEQLRQWKESHPFGYKPSTERIKPQQVIEKIWELTKGDCIITTDVGQHQMWTAQFFRFIKPRTLVTSGGLGTMGFGLPAAIGAQVAFPDRLVVDIAGDGGLQMTLQELATAVHNKLPVKIAIINNGFLGMVRQWQGLFFDKRYSQVILGGPPDFVKLAEAYGALGLRATKPAELQGVLERGLASPGVVLMDFVVDPEEDVYPMVPTGAPINEMLLA